MKSAVAAFATVLFLSAPAVSQYLNQSAPFNLILRTDCEKYNNTALSSCHEGAAIEGLCAGIAFNATAGYQTFAFNTSSSETVPKPQFGAQGYLVYTLRGSNFNESEPLTLFYNPASNVALPLFEPSETATAVAFDSENRLNIQSYLDDTVTPPNATTVRAYYRWYICQTNYEGYLYETLSWVAGKYPPENPSCVKTEVIRQAVSP